MSMLRKPDLPQMPLPPKSPVAQEAAGFAASQRQPLNFGTKSLISSGSVAGLATKAKTVKRSLIGSAS